MPGCNDAEMGPPTRYTLRCITASIIKDFKVLGICRERNGYIGLRNYVAIMHFVLKNENGKFEFFHEYLRTQLAYIANLIETMIETHS